MKGQENRSRPPIFRVAGKQRIAMLLGLSLKFDDDRVLRTCGITIVAVDKRFKDCECSRLFDSLATELGRYAATNICVWSAAAVVN